MLKYITSDEYQSILAVSSVPNNIEQLIIKASNYIYSKTFGRIDENNISDKIKYVTCLIVDLINEEETKISEISYLKSENVEGWSQSYMTPEEIKADYENKKYNILKEYLTFEIGTDDNYLLYCGV